MPHKSLEEKRAEMMQFLLENIVARSIQIEGQDVLFRGYNNVDFLIRAIANKSDFPYEFEKDPSRFDTDRDGLNAICRAAASFITETNENGLVPGFVLLRAEVDYPNLDARGTKRNWGTFLKQKLPSDKCPHPSYDQKVITPLELVLSLFYKNNLRALTQNPLTRGDSVYYPELNYFNPKNGLLEVIRFADIEDPLKFRRNKCVVCRNPNERQFDHKSCKHDRRYIDEIKQRGDARYGKKTWISRQRAARTQKHTAKVEGVRFKPFVLFNLEVLGIPKEKEYNIAVVE
jgi:hypothetical protein